MSERPPLICPFCTGPLADAAIRCAGCGQDVALVMPVMRRLRLLEGEVDSLRTELRAAPQTLATAPLATAPAQAAPSTAARLLLCLGLSFAALLLAHQIIVMRFDLPTILLRMASVAIPAASVLLLHPQASLGVQAVAGLLLGAGAALAMSAIVSAADGVPVIPRDSRGQRELAEYAISIGLAHFAGAAFLQLRQVALLRHRGVGLVDRASTAQRLAEAAMPLTALGASLYGGLRALLD